MAQKKQKRWKKKQFWAIGILNMWRIWRRRNNKHVLMTNTVSAYVEGLTRQSLDSNLSQMFEDSQSHHNSAMQIDISEAQFLQFLVKLIDAKQVLEIGTFRGWSAAVLATALSERSQIAGEDKTWRLTTIEVRNEQAEQATEFWNTYIPAAISSNINLIIGDAKSILVDTNQMHKVTQGLNYDLVFIDADKAGYMTYIELIAPYLRTGGIIVLDNMLNAGLVATSAQDRTTQSIRELNDILFNKKSSVVSQAIPQFETCMIPAWDGVVILRKK